TARTLGDTSAWALDVASRTDWTLTHFAERGERVAPSDFTFAPGWPASSPLATDTRASRVAHGSRGASRSHARLSRGKRALAALFAFALVFAAIAVLLDRDRRRRA